MRSHAIHECRFGLDGGAMFGIIPKPLWQRLIPADDANRITLAARLWLVERGDRRILVDSGMGEKWSAKERSIFAVDHSAMGIDSTLAAHNLTADDITDVIMTHLHFDHAGGLTRIIDERRVPTFPNATHWVQRENWLWAQSPSARDAGSYRRENFDFFGSPGAPPLRLVDGETELFDGVYVHRSNGHTPGMQLPRMDVAVAGTTKTVIYAADLVPTAAHVRLPYVMGYDCFPLATVAEKRALLGRVADEGWIMMLEHDPDHAYIRVERRGDDFAVADRSNDLGAI